MFNKSAIMTHAWTIVRRANIAKFGLLTILRRALRAAWAEAKHQLAMAERDRLIAAQSPEVARIRIAITALEGKNHWTQQDYARRGVLRAALRATREREMAAHSGAQFPA